MRFPFALSTLLLLALSLPASAQVCGPGGCGPSSFGGFGGGFMNRGYSQPTYLSSPSAVYYETTPSRVVRSTSRSSSPTQSYSVDHQTGDVLAPNGDKVRSVGGVEIVARSYAERFREGGTPPTESAATTTTGSCNCDNEIWALQMAINRLSDRVDELQETIERSPIYREEKPTTSQRDQRDEIQERIAKMHAIRAAWLASPDPKQQVAVR